MPNAGVQSAREIQMNVTHPGLGGYDTVERQMHRDAICDIRDYPAPGYPPIAPKTAERVRAATISGHVLAILVASTTLAIIALCVVLAVMY